MRFHADLHVHSKHSRATSRDLDLEHLAHWAARKGIGVVGTGDCVHPVWLAELKDKLVPDTPGLFRLRPDLEAAVMATLPAPCRNPVRFMLSTEISTIYKKGDRTRKIHHLIYGPDFATIDRLQASLARIGNIASDGRPILGLDSRDLLEIALASGPDAYLVPAHIWTPWFAALGSQSGFDSIAECYGELSDHIFAVETGLSSDPAMNWRISFLDRYRLTSNSDAHSPGKLGREATEFDCDPDYHAIRRALETGEGYVGTVEFFPEEGKYHADGHRRCDVRLSPQETLALDGRCPVCGQPVTVGVLHRIETLADRSEAEAVPPPTAGAITSLVPLPEILSELLSSGPASKTVERTYDRLVGTLGSELSILGELPVEDIARAESELLAEAVTRLRKGQVIRDAGYDGEYGVIRLFGQQELKSRTAGGLLFDLPQRRTKTDAAGPERGLSRLAGEVGRPQDDRVRAGPGL
uniref:endonuclease Q family protein n=1 Tax=Inquilinus sp. TaxID=1932117 RepID=UPI00378316B3